MTPKARGKIHYIAVESFIGFLDFSTTVMFHNKDNTKSRSCFFYPRVTPNFENDKGAIFPRIIIFTENGNLTLKIYNTIGKP